MSAVFSAILVTLCVTVCADAQIQTLALFTRAEGVSDSAVVHAAQQELQRLLTPAKFHVVWKTQQASTDQFEQLVVGSFAGDCSMSEGPARGAVRKTNALAETPVQGRGRVLPFFTVDCGRLVQTLWPTLNYLGVPLRQSMLGRALGRVIAHEIYHILAQAKDHTNSGIAKASLSMQDLMTERFAFDSTSLQRIRATTAGGN